MKRVALTIVVFVLLGAVVNVAVAWGFAMWSRPYSVTIWQSSHSWPPWWHVTRFRGPGVTRIWYVASVEVDEWSNVRPGCVPKWSSISGRRPGTEDLAKSLRVEDARGWPVLAMTCEIEIAYPIEYLQGKTVDPEIPLFAIYAVGVAGGIPMKNVYPNDTPARAPPGATYNDGFWDVRVLPLRPIWPGFAVNTLFYAAILWLLIYGAALRRFLRVRRGLCPKCAYPMGESVVCTECGQKLQQRVRPET